MPNRLIFILCALIASIISIVHGMEEPTLIQPPSELRQPTIIPTTPKQQLPRQQAEAEEGITTVPINGGFGLYLNRIYRGPNDNKKYIKISKAPKPYRKFTSYAIVVNDQKEIFHISAEYNASSVREAEKEFEVCKKALELKYKTKFKQASFGGAITNALYIEEKNGNRNVILILLPQGVEIQYRDNQMISEDDKSRQENEEKQTEQEAANSDLEAI